MKTVEMFSFLPVTDSSVNIWLRFFLLIISIWVPVFNIFKVTLPVNLTSNK